MAIYIYFLWCPTFSKVTNDICKIYVSEDVSVIHYVVGKLTREFMVMYINYVIRIYFFAILRLTRVIKQRTLKNQTKLAILN